MFETKDSGNRRTFSGGAQRDRDSEVKGRYDLLPPYAILRLAQLFARGANKYQPRNWEEGIPVSCFIDSGLRHGFQYLEGKRDEDHLIAAAWNFLCAVDTQERIKRGMLSAEFDDLPAHPDCPALDK